MASARLDWNLIYKYFIRLCTTPGHPFHSVQMWSAPKGNRNVDMKCSKRAQDTSVFLRECSTHSIEEATLRVKSDSCQPPYQYLCLYLHYIIEDIPLSFQVLGIIGFGAC